MSINHLIDPTIPTPRYDIYVNDIDCNELKASEINADNIFATGFINAPTIVATTEMQMAEQNNYNDILSIPAFASGSFLFDEGDNTFTNLSDIFQYVTTRKVAANGYVDTYKLSWTGEATLLPSDDAIFDFKALNNYDIITRVFATAQSSDTADTNDVGVQINPPSDPANDFEIQFNTDLTGALITTDVVLFHLEIQLYRV